MKHLILLLTIFLFSQSMQSQENNESYTALWKKVNDFEIESLPKSALKIVESIKIKAKKDKNASQLIKSMIFKSKFVLILEEDAQLNIITDFKNEIEKASFPTKNILESYLANLYWQYFQQNRWKFYNRTKTSKKVDNQDFRTWDLQTLFNEIHVHYQNSLQNGLMSQLEPLRNYDTILTTQENSKIYRPTLFDFLSHNALEFYKTNETHITRPAYKFEINNPHFLSDANTYSLLKIESKDSISLQLNTLKIYQNLIKFHLKNKSQKALASVNIERLKFVNEYATFKNKQDILLKNLLIESEKQKTNEVSALYNFEIASAYYELSKKYNPTTFKEYRWKAKEAITICTKVIAEFPKSTGTEKCKLLKQQIELQSLNITTENYIPTQKKSRLL